MFVFALMLAATQPTPLTAAQQHDIDCVVDVAILAEQQRKGEWTGVDLQQDGRRWTGMVGARIVEESGQTRELVAFALNEAAKARAGKIAATDSGSACLRQMKAELAAADAISKPLPKPVKTQ
jgi:hypothetical protein